MTRNGLLDSPAEATPRTRRRVGEVAGGTAADCAAVFCCCPCSLMNLLILAVYKVPRGVCKKAWAKAKNNKRSKNKNKGLLPVGPARFSDDVSEKASDDECFDNKSTDDAESESAVFEKEMWDRFYGAGFWRTDSMKQT